MSQMAKQAILQGIRQICKTLSQVRRFCLMLAFLRSFGLYTGKPSTFIGPGAEIKRVVVDVNIMAVIVIIVVIFRDFFVTFETPLNSEPGSIFRCSFLGVPVCI